MRQVIRAVRLVHQPTVARISRRRRERRLRKQHRRQHRRSSSSSTRPHNQRYTSRYKTSISLTHYPSLELSGATRFYRLQLELNLASLGRKDISHQRLPLDGLIGFTKWIYLGTFISLSLWRVRGWATGKKRLTRCCILKNFFFLHPASFFYSETSDSLTWKVSVGRCLSSSDIYICIFLSPFPALSRFSLNVIP